MNLTLLLLYVDRRLPTANALKNMLIGAAAIASAIVLALAGPVTWRAAAPLAVGMLVGSTLGPRVARRLPTRLLRLLIVALALELWIRPSG
jgi:uncharacterized protein